MTHHGDRALLICDRLSAANRKAIVERFCAINPHWRGAEAADIIDELDNNDSNLVEVELAWERFPQLRLPGFGMAVRALYWAGMKINDDNLRNLLEEEK